MFICLLLVFSFPICIQASENELIDNLDETNNEIQASGEILWIVIGWAVGKWVLDPLWEEIVDVYDTVSDYFVALRLKNQFEAEARRKFYEMYPNGQIVVDSGSNMDEERYYYIPFGYELLPY